ncbi:MAG: hypothetical protein LBK52_06975, partial [Deltaproteobacteria bacterium]|nr:hypothetical protein [Deltaproteobacteria bacterium]
NPNRPPELKNSRHRDGFSDFRQDKFVFRLFLRLAVLISSAGRQPKQLSLSGGLEVPVIVRLRPAAAVLPNPIQSNPVQSSPIQSSPVQSNPIQSNPVQSSLVQVFGQPGSFFWIRSDRKQGLGF